MKKISDINANTQHYWDNCYGNKEKRNAYASGGTHIDIENISLSTRFIRALDEVEGGDKCLDIGCGVGVFTKMIKARFPNNEVWGTDISAQACKDNTFENPYIKYLCQVVGQQHDVPDNYFDFVFAGEILEHLDEPETLFNDAFRVLKEHGKFLVTTPYEDKIRSNEHVWTFNHEDVEKLFLQAGFKNVNFIYLPRGEHFLVIMATGIK